MWETKFHTRIKQQAKLNCVHYITVSVSRNIYRRMMEFYENDELERIWKESDVALFHIYQQLLGETEENHEKPLVMIVGAPTDFRTRNLPTASHKPNHKPPYHYRNKTLNRHNVCGWLS